MRSASGRVPEHPVDIRVRTDRGLVTAQVETFAALSPVPADRFDRVGKASAAMTWNVDGGGTDVFL